MPPFNKRTTTGTCVNIKGSTFEYLEHPRINRTERQVPVAFKTCSMPESIRVKLEPLTTPFVFTGELADCSSSLYGEFLISVEIKRCAPLVIGTPITPSTVEDVADEMLTCLEFVESASGYESPHVQVINHRWCGTLQYNVDHQLVPLFRSRQNDMPFVMVRTYKNATPQTSIINELRNSVSRQFKVKPASEMSVSLSVAHAKVLEQLEQAINTHEQYVEDLLKKLFADDDDAKTSFATFFRSLFY